MIGFVIRQTLEGLRRILQPFKGSQNDCNNSTLRKITYDLTCDHSTLRSIENLILQPVEGFKIQSINPLKDCMQYFNPSKDYI